MGQKVNPTDFRTGVIYGWKSNWFSNRKYADLLREDFILRGIIMEKFKEAGVSYVQIDRSAKQVIFKLHSSRPGMIIGRGGKGIEDIKVELSRILRDKGEKVAVQVDIVEIKNPGSTSQLVADAVVEQLLKRMPFRKILKQNLESVFELGEVQGVKIAISGRLDGSEMARREWLAKGNIPLQTLRADIDFARSTAFTSYGTIGVKVWIYKGLVFGKGIADQEPEKDKLSKGHVNA